MSFNGRKIFSNLFLVLFGLFVALVCAELFLRLAVRFGLEPVWKYQRVLLDGETRHPKHKVLILGDSFVTHWETGYSLYELLVRDLTPHGASLLDTAEGGFGPIDYLTQLRAYGPSYHPDTVLLFYYVGNDLTSVQYRGDLWNWFKQHFKPWVTRLRLFYLISNMREQWFQSHLKYKEVQKRGIDEEAFRLAKKRKINPWLLDLSREKKNFILDNVLMETPENKKAWEKVQGLLKETQRFCQKIHARLILIVIPHTTQINSSHFSFYRRLAFEVDDRTLSSKTPQILMKEFCQKEQMLCLDLLPSFLAEKGKEFYREGDDHFNEEGFRLSEKLVMEFLEKNMNLAGHGS